MNLFCCFCFCLLSAFLACLFSDLLKPFLVEEHENKPFDFVFPPGGVAVYCSRDEYPPIPEMIVKQFCKALLLTQNFLCPYHSPSSGKVERTHGIFKLNLAQLSETLEFPWPKVLPLALMIAQSPPLRVQHFPHKLVTSLPKHLGISPLIPDAALLEAAIAKYWKGAIQ